MNRSTMKKLLPFVFAMLAMPAFSQVGFNGLNYQAVARDANGDPLAGTTITVMFALHQTTPMGAVLYVEQHNPTTNDLGLFTVGAQAPSPPRGSTGLYHLAWQVEHIEDAFTAPWAF